jgi:anti-sigma factor RsiW
VTERRHPDTALTGYVTGALLPAERAQVEAHLGGCVDCRRAVEESRAVLDALATSVAEPPALDWGRYRADLRARVERAPRRAWWARPLPAIVDRRPAELATVEETVLGARLPLLQQYRVVERLDMLEDLDAIRQLDRFGHGGS